MLFYVYTLSRPDGSVFYVGKGSGRRRFRSMTQAGGYNPHKERVIAKVVRDGGKILVEVVEYFTDEQDAGSFEVELIAAIGRYPKGPLTNLTDGGEGTVGYRHTDAAKAAMSQWRKGRKLSASHVAAIRKGQEGVKHKPHDEAHKAKISKALKGRAFSESHRQALSRAMTGNTNGKVDETLLNTLASTPGGLL